MKKRQKNQTTKADHYQPPEQELYIAGLCLLLLLPVCLLVYRFLSQRFPIFRLPCLLHTFTGYYCPGCGGTRAVYALLHLHPVRSFLYHPLVPYAAFLYLWFMVSHTIERVSRGRLPIGMRWRDGFAWGALAILLVNAAVRDGALYFFHVDVFTWIP